MHTDALVARRLFDHLAGEPLPDWSEIEPTVRRERLRAGETLFDADRPWPWIAVVTAGLFKLVYLRADGTERIKSFIAEGGFFASLAGLAPGGRASFSGVALEDSAVELIGYEPLRAIAERHLAWQRALRVGIELYGARKEKRERELLTLRAEERYRLFIAEEPALATRVAQKDLALYLGITPVALSRIRARVGRSLE